MGRATGKEVLVTIEQIRPNFELTRLWAQFDLLLGLNGLIMSSEHSKGENS